MYARVWVPPTLKATCLKRASSRTSPNLAEQCRCLRTETCQFPLLPPPTVCPVAMAFQSTNIGIHITTTLTITQLYFTFQHGSCMGSCSSHVSPTAPWRVRVDARASMAEYSCRAGARDASNDPQLLSLIASPISAPPWRHSLRLICLHQSSRDQRWRWKRRSECLAIRSPCL